MHYIDTLEPLQTPSVRSTGNIRSAYLIWLLIMGLVICSAYLLYDGSDWEYHTRLGIVFGCILFVAHFFYKSVAKPANFLAPDIVYLLAYFLFHYGYLILWMCGIVPFADLIFADVSLYPKTLLIANLGFLSFAFGYELFGPQNVDLSTTKTRKEPRKGWFIVGIALMLIALLIHCAYILIVGVDVFIREGYIVSAKMERYVSNVLLWRLSDQIFALGFGAYIISVALKYGKLFRGKLGIGMFVFYFILLVLEGGRTQLVTVGMILLLVRHYFIKPVKFRWLLVFFIITVSVFAAIKLVRNVSAFDISKMHQELKYMQESEQAHWYDSFVEMGSSIRTVNLTTMLVPDAVPYWYGRSYVQSVTHIVPYAQGFLVRYLGLTPAQWLTYTLYGSEAAGTGFTIAAEGYLNFGIPGVVMHMVLMAFLFSKIYAYLLKAISPARAMVFIVSFGIFVVSVRNHSNVVFAPVAHIIIVAWLMKVIAGQIDVASKNEPLPEYAETYE